MNHPFDLYVSSFDNSNESIIDYKIGSLLHFCKWYTGTMCYGIVLYSFMHQNIKVYKIFSNNEFLTIRSSEVLECVVNTKYELK